MLNQLGQASTSYNVPAVLLLEGSVDKKRLEEAMQALINRHETLRTSFDMAEEKSCRPFTKMCRLSLKPPRAGKKMQKS
ncbi:condensation domain-containing protein [Bacillus velezensis]|nr:condensation domain-containing protein [Bacillus velezensis]